MNLSAVAGVDEAGRGPLAGPVVAAAVILPDSFPIAGLNDSKLLTSRQRSYFCALIHAKALAVSTAMIQADEIDRINILQASLKAMALSVSHLAVLPKEVLVDGNRTIPELDLPQKAIIKGDRLHPAIMCASIVAKVARDRWMLEVHKKYPEYGFRYHKGYGTASHLKALRLHGPSPIHRKSFSPVKEAARGDR